MLLKILRIGVIWVRPNWNSPDLKKSWCRCSSNFLLSFSRNPSVHTGFFMDVDANHNNVDDDNIKYSNKEQEATNNLEDITEKAIPGFVFVARFFSIMRRIFYNYIFKRFYFGNKTFLNHVADFLQLHLQNVLFWWQDLSQSWGRFSTATSSSTRRSWGSK